MKNYYNIIETLVAVVCVNEGIIEVLLKKKQTEPYKGYWIMPSDFLMTTETLEENVKKIIESATGLKNIFFKQCNILSNLDRDANNRILAFPFLALTTKENVLVKMKDQNYCWFKIDTLPKLGYDHNKILKVIYKEIVVNVKTERMDFIHKLFPNDFTLPELQKFYENVLDKKIDRRNFRKKLIMKNLIEDTGYKNNDSVGRPGRVYRFKDEVKENVK